ncbi:hypothetical protein EDD15DRAFT_2243881 [Pisolithus albus]|nr:hypothetical protein EDD15DRAFT_2243881 [Pisolithus albus]
MKMRNARTEVMADDTVWVVQWKTETILQTGRLFLRKLALTSTDTEQHFLTFGASEQTHIPIDVTYKQPRGPVHVKFKQSLFVHRLYYRFPVSSSLITNSHL